MAYAINAKSYLPPEPMAYPHRQTAADKTATTTVTTGGFGDLVNTGFLWYFRVKILIKVLVGTLTVVLETADDTGFATNKQQIAVSGVQASGVLGSMILQGWTDVSTNQYYRIGLTFGTSGTVDIEVVATQVV